MDLSELLTIAQAAALTGFTPGHLAQLRYRGAGPVYLRLSPRSIRYRRADIDRWIEESQVAPRNAPGPAQLRTA